MAKWLVVPIGVLLSVGWALGLDDEDAPPPVEAGTIVVLDPAGKEQKVSKWSLAAGVKPLGWLAPAAKDKDKAAAPPRALAVVDAMKISFLPSVETLVPLDRIRAVEFDKDKETMTVRAAVTAKPDDDAVLIGSTAYRGVNKLTIRAEVDMGKEGVAEITFQGGVSKGIRAVRFPAPQVDAAKPGRPALVTTVDGNVKKTIKTTDLQALYEARGRQKLAAVVMFRKTLKIDLANVKKIVASTEDADDVVWQVTRKEGGESTLTLLTKAPLDGETATFVGLLGKVPAGYVLIPPRRVGGVEFDVAEEKKKDLIDAP